LWRLLPPVYFLHSSNDWGGCCPPPCKGFTLRRSAAPTSKWHFFPGLPSWSPEIQPSVPVLDSRDFERS
jgi:hypothetical protein